MASQATTGMTVQTLAKLLAMYADRNPEAVVTFSSSESGGYWPTGSAKMGVFIDDQVAVVDSTRVGGDVTLDIALMARVGDKG
jgi:hypothetical protein